MSVLTAITALRSRWIQARMKGALFHPGLMHGGYSVDVPTHSQRTILAEPYATIFGWSVDDNGGRGTVVLRIGRRELTPDVVRRVDVRQALGPRVVNDDVGFEFRFVAPFGISLATLIRTDTQAQALRRVFLVRFEPVWLTRWRSARRTRGLKANEHPTLRFSLDGPKPTRLKLMSQPRLVVHGWAVDVASLKAVSPTVLLDGLAQPPHPKKRGDVQCALASLGALPEETGFEVGAELSVGFHDLDVEIRTGDTVVSLFKGKVLRLPSMRSRVHSRSYEDWTELEAKLHAHEAGELGAHIAAMLYKPSFRILVAPGGKGDLEETKRSLASQIYPVFTVDEGSTSAIADRTPADFVLPLAAGDRLHPAALYRFADRLNREPDLDMLYADEDRWTAGRRTQPFFKPDWSPDYLETLNYVGAPAVYRASVAAGLQAFSRYDLALKFTEQSTRIGHIGTVLCHRTETSALADTVGDIAALQGRLRRTGRTGHVAPLVAGEGAYRIKLSLKRKPLVSVVIPTAGKVVRIGDRTLDLVVHCVEQLRLKTSYAHLEIIIVHNGNLCEGQERDLTAHKCKLVLYDKPIFNIAEKLNLGATQATGRLLLLLNDDIEVIDEGWLACMIQHFEKPHVGVVGAKLLYPDTRVQHAGVVHNSGNPDHVRRLAPRDDHGYFFSTSGVRNFMAVTGACMMTPLAVYRAVGGYSEALAVSYNDADYCMKVRQLGRSVVYEPAAELIHFESVSREASLDIGESNFYHQRWAREVTFDGFYNERFLTVASPTFEPLVNPRRL